MTSYPQYRGSGGGDDGNGGGGGQQPPGWLSRADGLPETSRRRRLAGYLKAANELRVTYQQTAQDAWKNRNVEENFPDDDDYAPGDFPEAAVVQKGDHQMVLFPSYARRHVRQKPKVSRETASRTTTSSVDQAGQQDGGGPVIPDADYWRKQWDKYDHDRAVVDVDVRGWLYTPHRGAMNRKQRLFVSLARQLAGLPNAPPGQSSGPSSGVPSRSTSPQGGSRRDEELIAKQAESIVQKGQAEAELASRGRYSEQPGKDSDQDSLIDLGPESPPSDSRSSAPSGPSRAASTADPSPLKQVTHVDATTDDEPVITAIQKRASWNQPADMSASELALANSNLTGRLRPFLANPLAGVAISAFFYNEETSQLRTIYTDPNGHFSIRVALDFIPTHVRILASDELSATEEVIVTPTRGVSLISDIDDTIKHSAIGSGPREIFRNAFIRDLNDLVIEGVKQLYADLAAKGVKFHYVSNSPWQLYPVLTKYFKLAGLPPGSFHLKQYSGMLQGIFEPVAERKKSTLDRLARDFPERSFLLFGDSGEADLEVYTDFVLENPGRVLGIFIRDVTTTKTSGFFSSHNPSPSGSPYNSPPRTPRFSPRLSPRLAPSNYFGSSAKRRSYTRAPQSFSLDEDADPELQAAIKASIDDLEQEYKAASQPAVERRVAPGRGIQTAPADDSTSRPTLPPRRTGPPAPEAHQMGPPMGELIDLSDEPPTPKPAIPAKPADMLKPTKSVPEHVDRPLVPKKPSAMHVGDRHSPSPQPPKKPAALHGSPVHDESDTYSAKPPPPKPLRRSNDVSSAAANGEARAAEQSGYIAAAGQTITAAYNALPSIRDKLPGADPTGSTGRRTPLPPPDMNQLRSNSSYSTSRASTRRAPLPPPPRRSETSSSHAGSTYPNGRVSGLIQSETLAHRPTASTTSSSSRSDILSPYSTRATTGPTGAGASDTTTTPPNGRTRTAPTGAPVSRTSTLRSEQAGEQQQQAQQQQQLSKKEALWRQRWLVAAQTLRDKGVVLRTWRVGADIERDVMGLVEEALRRDAAEEAEEGRGGAPKPPPRRVSRR